MSCSDNLTTPRFLACLIHVGQAIDLKAMMPKVACGNDIASAIRALIESKGAN